MIQKYMEELDRYFEINVRTLYLRAPLDVVQRRVADRLAREPWRKRYHDDDDGFLRKTYDYYEDHISEWDFVISNDREIAESIREVRGIIGRK
jgi:thymidylate kinase